MCKEKHAHASATAMPSVEELLEPTALQKRSQGLAEDGYFCIEAKMHSKSRRFETHRTPPSKDALERAGDAVMRGATEVEPINRRDVYAKTNGLCYLCGTRILINRFHVDHVIPLHHGGTHTWPNVFPCCKQCNVLKGANPVSVSVDDGAIFILAA